MAGGRLLELSCGRGSAGDVRLEAYGGDCASASGGAAASIAVQFSCLLHSLVAAFSPLRLHSSQHSHSLFCYHPGCLSSLKPQTRTDLDLEISFESVSNYTSAAKASQALP